MPGPRALRLLHTSDVHVGDENYPRLRLAGLGFVIDAAIAQRVDGLLIAGDLFDSARVKPADVDATWAQLARVSVPVILIPGNHDCLGQPSIYSRASHRDAGDHVRFLREPDGEHLTLHELGITFWARGLVDHHPANFPLRGYQRLPDGNWQVVMAHGHYVPAGVESDRSSPLPAEQLGALDCDYVALGHWHGFEDVSVNATRACYSGSPAEPGRSDATANLITFEPGVGVGVERVALPAYDGPVR